MKRTATILLAVILILTLTACNPGNKTSDTGETPAEANPQEIDIDVSALTEAVIEDGDFPEMVERDTERLTERYFNIETDGIVEASVRFNPAGAYPDEIAVIKTESPAKANEIKTFFEEYLYGNDGRINFWETYEPGQMYKLDEAVINVKNEYAVLFICDNSEKANQIFEDNF